MKTATTNLSRNVLVASAIRRLSGPTALLLVAAGLLLTACGPSMTRCEVQRKDLEKLRSVSDEQAAASGERFIVRLLERTKAEYDRRAAVGSHRR